MKATLTTIIIQIGEMGFRTLSNAYFYWQLLFIETGLVPGTCISIKNASIFEQTNRQHLT
jgi:hypothetical protein